MRESRVLPWVNPTTISADGATNGPDIDLLSGYTGDHLYGTNEYGVPVEFIAKSVVTGTGDGFTVTLKWQTAPDNAGVAGTYVDQGTIGVFTVDTDGNFMKDGVIYQLTRAKLQSRLKATVNAWGRVVATAAGITGGESLVLSGFFVDGTVPYADTGIIL